MRLFSSSRVLYRVLAAVGAAGGIALASSSARAQVAGTTSGPIPDVLLLVDSSGSMQRMIDGSLPGSTLANTCSPGTASTPNKWGMLVQALTGNMQPFYSCQDLDRSGLPFKKEFSINGIYPYDADYNLNYARPLSGLGTAGACVFAPHSLPGAPGMGVGLLKQGSNTKSADFPDDAFASIFLSKLNTKGGATDPILADEQCIFSQGTDGQLDGSRDFARFALMTFDNMVDAGTGVIGTFESGSPTVDPAAPFTGTWSYTRHGSNPYIGQASTAGSDNHAQGMPLTSPACLPTPQEVGARHEGAPPWEGRLVKFPPANASLYDLQRSNDQLQQVLVGSRPFGATPIDGMMDDARDYYNYYSLGEKSDPYKACRKRYIVLLTDGAPNLDLRPSCMGGSTATGPGATCPFPQNASEIAYDLVTATTAPITTYVIGFAVAGETPAAGDGFPTSIPTDKKNCKGWFENTTADGGNNSAATLQTYCSAHTIPAGSTAAACCKLNEIALKGSSAPSATPVGAFFAESQADISLAFGRIMASITRDATTRTIPVSTPPSAAGIVAGATVPASASFVASLIPSTQRPWSGELDRTRFTCSASATPVKETQQESKGDSSAFNLSKQSSTGAVGRLFISVLPDTVNSGIDAAATIRPFATTLDEIKAPVASSGSNYPGKEVSMGTDLSYPLEWPLALNITNRTCTQGRAVVNVIEAGLPGASQIIPALNADYCTKAVWGFATAYHGSDQQYPGTPTGTSYKFNVRCPGGSSNQGIWSVTGTTCTVGQNPPIPGEVCVPSCAALGAIYHANPVVLGPPAAYSRDEGYNAFQTRYRSRQPITFVATIDGLLHAFRSLTTTTDDTELWAFVPPAVLPRLASNYPQGNQVLLDGTPVVTETVWDRGSTTIDPGLDWHTTLVAGLGSGRGYYALNVTDTDCKDANPSNVGCPGSGYQAPTEGNLAQVSNSGSAAPSVTPMRGPHFLWQLTDIPSKTGSSETAKADRLSTIPGNPAVTMRSLFGQHTGTPAIATVQMLNTGGQLRQVGVAILPGGYEDPPVPGAYCNRTTAGLTSMADGATAALATFGQVRKWGAGCNDDVGIPGRGITIVRLDTGEIIRHFGRVIDTPLEVQSRLGTPVPFDSPVVGTPVVYPNSVGVPIQKIFVGDADGTLWRLDVSNTNPMAWTAALYQDLSGVAKNAAQRQAIQVAPVVSTDDVGNVVIHAATGDQDSITYDAGAQNYVFSITEARSTSTNLPTAYVNWYVTMTGGERTTGPMAVFDRNLYFASFAPTPDSAACSATGSQARLWGLDFVGSTSPSTRTNPIPKWCVGVPDANGFCPGGLTQFSNQGNDIIPGVTVQATTSCVAPETIPGDVLGNTGAFSSMTPVSYSLNFGISKSESGTLPSTHAARQQINLPIPRVSTRIDSWSIVIE